MGTAIIPPIPGEAPSSERCADLAFWLPIAHSSRVGTSAVPEAWQAALDGWEGWLKAGGAPVTTIEQRLYQMRRVARDHATLTPWEVTLDHLVLWLAQHPHWKPTTRRSHRGALRAFYAWAVKNGQYDDMDGPAHRILYDDDKDMIPREARRNESKPDDQKDDAEQTDTDTDKG